MGGATKEEVGPADTHEYQKKTSNGRWSWLRKRESPTSITRFSVSPQSPRRGEKDEAGGQGRQGWMTASESGEEEMAMGRGGVGDGLGQGGRAGRDEARRGRSGTIEDGEGREKDTHESVGRYSL